MPIPPEQVDAMLAEGRIVDHDGPGGPDTPFVPHSVIWFQRDLPDEPTVPFALDVSILGSSCWRAGQRARRVRSSRTGNG